MSKVGFYISERKLVGSDENNLFCLEDQYRVLKTKTKHKTSFLCKADYTRSSAKPTMQDQDYYRVSRGLVMHYSWDG